MAAARDQAARILRTEPERRGRAVRDASAALPSQLRAHVSEETAAPHPPRRRQTGRGRTGGAPTPRRGRRAEIRQAQIRPDGHRRAARARRGRLRRALYSGRTLSTSRPTTPMCAPTTPRSARGCPDTSRRSFPATTRWSRPARWSSRSTTAIIASRSMPRAPGSRPSRPPSTGSAARSPRWKARSSRPRRSSPPRKPA